MATKGALDTALQLRSRHDEVAIEGKMAIATHGRLTRGPRITWKAVLEESFSDWRIEVCYDQMGGERDVYHIHRNIYGFGPRKSDYLLQDFRSLSRRDVVYGGKAYITRLDLPAACAHDFPMVLDFMYYSQESKQTLTAERAACHVFKLAKLLSIPGLQKAIADFYIKNFIDLRIRLEPDCSTD